MKCCAVLERYLNAQFLDFVEVLKTFPVRTKTITLKLASEPSGANASLLANDKISFCE